MMHNEAMMYQVSCNMSYAMQIYPFRSHGVRMTTVSPKASIICRHRCKLTGKRVLRKALVHIPEESKEPFHSVCFGRRGIIDHVDDT